MLIAHYTHRLPADYDLEILRRRAAQRGPLWDNKAELYFKAFVLRAAGQDGAIANSYSAFYLWRQAAALHDFIADGTFRSVTDSFGRPVLNLRIAVDARKGPAAGAPARFLAVEHVALPLDADLPAELAAETARNRQAAQDGDTVAATSGLDTAAWTLTRLRLTAEAPASAGDTYQVLYLARPLLETLPLSGDR
ncbi:MAG: DUF4865 family protein [Azospirillaceae bacterium]|nr:DUF4865 family protein [Azospirillaceae bacterium]